MLYNVFTNILAVVFVLGVMILIHELGHFIAAKYFGIKVHVFSFGFGPRLFGFKRGDTDYRVCALPLGGYVKMAGEQASDETTGSEDEFQSKPRWQRFVVAIMGPAMNIFLAIFLLTGLYMYRYEKPAYQEGPAVIGWVEDNTPAAEAGFQPGDRIVSINNRENPNWQDIEILVVSNPNQPMDVDVERNGQIVSGTITPEPQGRTQLGAAGWFPSMPAALQVVEPNMPASDAGLQAGDVITAVNGEPITFWPKVSEIIQENQGGVLDITYRRNGVEHTTRLTPVQGPGEDAEPRWRIGVAFHTEVITRQLSLGDAFSQSLATNVRFAGLIFEFVGKIFGGEMSARTLEGPIGIARLSGQAARQSWADLLSLMAAISLNLGIFNLFPIPVLDGGVILLLLIEGTIRRDLSRQFKERVTQVGFAALMLLAVFVIYNDIVKSLPERFERFLP